MTGAVQCPPSIEPCSEPTPPGQCFVPFPLREIANEAKKAADKAIAAKK
jgi:hypothetical protein